MRNLRLVHSQTQPSRESTTDERTIEQVELHMSYVGPYAKSGLFDDARDQLLEARKWAVKLKEPALMVKHLCLVLDGWQQVSKVEKDWKVRFAGE